MPCRHQSIEFRGWSVDWNSAGKLVLLSLRSGGAEAALV
jgi:hypothetical protein